MYFTLTVNEQLANAMRAAAEFKVEYEKMSDSICNMMMRIGHTMGNMITEIALDEVRKLNPNNNRLNPESHVSE